MRLSNGRISASLGRLAHTLWNDRHPVIMVGSCFPFSNVGILVHLSCLSTDKLVVCLSDPIKTYYYTLKACFFSTSTL